MSSQQGYTACNASQASSGQAMPQEYAYQNHQQQVYQQQVHQQQVYQHQGYQQQAYPHQGYQQQAYSPQGYHQQGQQGQAYRDQQPAMTHQGHYSQQDQGQSYGYDNRYPANGGYDGAEAGSFRGDAHYADDANGYPRSGTSDMNRTAAFVAQDQARLGGPSHQRPTRRRRRTAAEQRIAEFDNVWQIEHPPSETR
ncbi:hypothetical protein QQZ08_000141 [Neonectria magnoliae]|uniref:Uncharacterized protein n=1 Tax=Neonectria magnoliae TaxID=2732573 RepID=A0ABR1IJF9_9HYPO